MAFSVASLSLSSSSSSVRSSSKTNMSSSRNRRPRSICSNSSSGRNRHSNLNSNDNANSRNRRLVDDCNDHNPIMRLPSRQDSRRRINENHSTGNSTDSNRNSNNEHESNSSTSKSQMMQQLLSSIASEESSISDNTSGKSNYILPKNDNINDDCHHIIDNEDNNFMLAKEIMFTSPDGYKDICRSSSSSSSFPSHSIVRKTNPFIRKSKTTQVINNHPHRYCDENRNITNTTDIETNNDYMLSKAIMLTSPDSKSLLCDNNIVRKTNPYPSKSDSKKGKYDNLYGLQKLANISESTAITESSRSLSGSISFREEIESEDSGSIVSSSTEVPEPPPLRNLNNLRNISQPGAFQINPTTYPVSTPTITNEITEVDADVEIDGFEEYCNVSQQHSTAIRSPSPRANNGSYHPYYSSSNGDNTSILDMQYLIEATLVEDFRDDDTMTSSFKGISALVTALDNEDDHFMNEHLSSERSHITGGGSRSAGVSMHNSVDLVEAEPLKNRGSCWFLFVIFLAFIALGTGGTLGINYDAVLAPRLGNFTIWTRAPKINEVPTVLPTLSLSKTLMLRVNDDDGNNNEDTSSSKLVLVHSTHKKKSNEPSPVPITKVTVPTNAPKTELDYLLHHVLPEYTKNAIINGDNDSPQYKAYKWLEIDQRVSSSGLVNNISMNRRLQRFVLAVFYYSTNGDKSYWRTNDGWMRHETHECDWYTDETTGIICSDDNENYKTLHLNNMNLTGAIPSELFLLSSLVKIDLSMNALMETIPTQIENCHNLRHLDLFGNYLSGPIPPFSSNDDNNIKMKQLTYLDLDGNLFSAKIPKGLSKLTKIRIASFMNNQLSGSIPTEIFAMWGGRKKGEENDSEEGSSSSISYHKRSIDFFDLAGNMLTGIIPTEIGLLGGGSATTNIDNGNGISMLDLSKNYLDGTIPTELGYLTDLKQLYLQDNQFYGRIPSELGNLKNLEVLWLDGTNIWGMIPNEVCALFHHGKLQDLSVNCLFVQCFYCECTCRL